MKNPIRPHLCARKLHALAAPERLDVLCFLRDGARNAAVAVPVKVFAALVTKSWGEVIDGNSF